jgi:hypothetical protein
MGGGIDWIGLAQDRYKWRAVVNVVMNQNDERLLSDCSSGAQLRRVSYVVMRVVASMKTGIELMN